MKKINILAILIIFFSCNSITKKKLTCNEENFISNIKGDIKNDIVEAWALKLAAESFDDRFATTGYQGEKYNWLDEMTKIYKEHLLKELKLIRAKEGTYYENAVKNYESNEIILENIITEKYDEVVDKCDCSAEIGMTNSDSRNNIDFDVERNSEEQITGHYRYKPKAMLDEKTNSSDFIKMYKRKYE